MKKVTVKALALVLSLLLVIPQCIDIAAYAAEIDDFTIENGVLVKYTGSGGDIVIPDGVIKIGENAFENCDGLTQVILPDSVIDIGNYAFNNCNSLTDVNLPNSITHLGYGVFFHCHRLTKIVIPDSVVSNDGGTFYDCNSLSDVSIGKGLTEIGYYMFQNCTNLKNIIVPDNITSIGFEAFQSCSSLKNIDIPQNILYIGDWAFEYCTSLADLNIIGNGSTNIGMFAFEGCSALKSVTMNNIASIGQSAFEYCIDLTTVNILGDVKTRIDQFCFEDLPSLTSLTINEVELGRGVFYGCLKLTNLKIAKGIIGDESFFDCENLKNVSIKNGVTSIGYAAFNNCGIDNLFIPGSVTNIGAWSFHGCENLIDVSIENGVTSIGELAFGDCFSLRTVNIPGSVLNIEPRTFAMCINLANVEIANEIQNIGNQAFLYCNNLKKITIPDSVINIGSDAFGNCSNLTIYGNKGSYAETYASDNKIPFSSLNYTEPATYAVRIEEKVSGRPIAGVSIGYNGDTAVTDSDGIALLELSDNYVETLTLSRDGDGILAESNAKTANASAYDGQTLNGVYLQTNKVNTFSLYKEGTQPGNMKFADPPESSDTMNGPSVDFMGYHFPLFKTDISMALPVFKDLQYQYDEEKKTIRVLLGFDEEAPNNFGSEYDDVKHLVQELSKGTRSTSWENLYSNLQNKATKSSVKTAFSASLQIMGYIEYSYATGQMVLTNGGLFSSGGVGYTGSSPISPLIYVKFGINGEIEAEGSLIYNRANNSTETGPGHFAMTLSPSMGIGAGIDKIVGLEGGIKGDIKGTINMPFHSLSENFIAIMNAKLYFKAQLLLMEQESTVKFLDYQIYPNTQATMRNNFKIDKDSMHLVPRDYLNKTQSLTLRTQNAGEFERSNVYPYGEPQLIEIDNNRKLLVWIDDNADRTSENRTELYYSIENSGGTWSAATAVSDDGTADFSPRLCKDSGKVYLVWKNAVKQFGTDVTLQEMSKNTDLTFSSFNGSQFSTPVNICTAGNSKMEALPSIAAANGKVCVSWIENSEDDPFMLEGTNSIRRAQYSNNVWQAPETISSGLHPISGMETEYVGATPIIAYSMDKDGDISTEEDSEIFLINDTISTQITDDSTDDLGVQFLNGNLYWCAGGSLKEMTGLNASSIQQVGLDCPADFTVFENNGKKAVLWLESSGYVKDAVISYESNGAWSNPVPVTNYQKAISSISALLNADGNVTLALDRRSIKENPSEGEFPLGDTDLIVMEGTQCRDTSVEQFVSYNKNEVKPGNDIQLIVKATNNSIKPIKYWNLYLKDENGQTISSNLQSYAYAGPGETAELDMYYTLPSNLTHHNIQFIAEPADFTDADLSNNAATAEFGFADLTVSSVNVEKTSSGATITAVVSNNGYDVAQNVRSQLYQDGASGTELDSQEVGTLAVGESKNITYYLSKEQLAIPDELIADQFYLDITSDSEDADFSNNGMSVVIDNRPEKVLLDNETVQISTESTMQLTATVEPDDAANKKVVWLSNNTEVATVDQNGMVTAIKEGTATISASAIDGGAFGVCEVTVHNAKILESISAPRAVTAYNGTAKTAEALGLPSTVELITNEDTVNADVNWDVNGCPYDTAITTEQKFTVTGAVVLPEDIGNPNHVSLTTTVEVTVSAADSGDVQTINAFEELDSSVKSQNVSFGTPRSSLNLSETLRAIVDGISGVFVNVSEWISDITYDPTAEGTYIFSPVLDSGYVLDSGITVPQIMVRVAAPSATDKIIHSFEPLNNSISIQDVDYGTPRSLLNLPNVLKAVVDGVSGVFVDISEWISNITYDPTTEGAYIFSPVLDSGYVLDSGVSLPEITVTVGAPSTADKIISSFDELEPSIKSQSVSKGTEFSSLDLPQALKAVN
ncbi:leucine-rich repeat protein [Caproiciproducens sp. R1]|uniref:leucine-rich repeat protein n=1 Tax=Caproiciproducens sp. R1 TaxID=3435000 RepID=UPI0040331D9F